MIQEKLEIAKTVAGKISRIEGVSCAYVDDYNKFGSVQIVAGLKLDKNKKPTHSNFNLRKINNEIKRILKNETEVSKIGINLDSPKRIYETYRYRSFSETTFTGYEKSYIMIDFTIVLSSEQIRIAV